MYKVYAHKVFQHISSDVIVNMLHFVNLCEMLVVLK